MKYKFMKRDGKWIVFEVDTEQVIDTFAFEADARKMARFMNRGGAFAGWTPTFMMISCAIDPIDTQLESLLA
jgi:hypothetical protein